MALKLHETPVVYDEAALHEQLQKARIELDPEMQGWGYTFDVTAWTMERLILVIRTHAEKHGGRPTRYRILYPRLLLLMSEKKEEAK